MTRVKRSIQAAGGTRWAVYAAGLGLLLLITTFLPPWEPVFVALRAFQALAVVALAAPLAALRASLSPRDLVLLPLLAAAFGGLLQWLWWRGIAGRVALAALLLLNTALGALLVLYMEVLVGPPDARWVKPVAAGHAIRVTRYSEWSIAAYKHFFFSATNDDGRTWRQIMHLERSAGNLPPEENVQALDERTYWVWWWSEVAVTSDGGRTWHTFDATQVSGLAERIENSFIESVTFTDARNGTMVFWAPAGDPRPTLVTADGGATWVEQ